MPKPVLLRQGPPGTTGPQDIQDSAKYLVMGYFGRTSFPGVTLFDDGRNHPVEYFPRLYQSSLFIENIRVLDGCRSKMIQKNEISPQKSDVKSIVLNHVSFSYAGEQQILQDITLTCNRGEKTAIVGENGAGKTTLIKLIVRLYDPDNGEILLNGSTNYNEINQGVLRGLFAVIYQDYQCFSYTLAHNILMKPVITEDDREYIWNILGYVGLADKVRKLPKGIDTELTREFSNDGVLFSGGELQKLAIGRALAKDAPVIILDEPSSALDPIAEDEIGKLLLRLFDDKIMIIVSHRLSLTKTADHIIFLENGRIEESGSHETLLRLNRRRPDPIRTD
jgi:ATP-binding cassette subfamily B protein